MKEHLGSYLDKSGNNVRVGDYIVYGHNLGRCAALRFGRVFAITVREKKYTWLEDECGITVSVLGVDDDGGDRHPPQLCKRKGNLMFPHRTLLANNLIPKEYKKLYARKATIPMEGEIK